MRAISRVTFLVDDYDEAVEWFTTALGFVLVEDVPLGDKRWVVVSPRDGAETELLLARPSDDDQRAHVGNQTGGRVFLILHTDDFARDHAAMLASGVRFLEAPRHEPYGSVAVFEDRWGNRWDLLEPRPDPG